MNLNKIFHLAGIFLLLFIYSCHYYNEETLYATDPMPGNNGCDTTNISYSGDIQAIISQNCLECHSNAESNSRGAGIRLEDYADLKRNTANDRLWNAVNHESGYSPMPKGRTKLDDCTLMKLKKWIDDGTPNN